MGAQGIRRGGQRTRSGAYIAASVDRALVDPAVLVIVPPDKQSTDTRPNHQPAAAAGAVLCCEPTGPAEPVRVAALGRPTPQPGHRSELAGRVSRRLGPVRGRERRLPAVGDVVEIEQHLCGAVSGRHGGGDNHGERKSCRRGSSPPRHVARARRGAGTPCPPGPRVASRCAGLSAKGVTGTAGECTREIGRQQAGRQECRQAGGRAGGRTGRGES